MNDDIDKEIQLVRDRLGRSDVNREAIALLVVRLIELTNPDKQVEMAAHDQIKILSADGESASIHLHNLWIECEQSPGERSEIVERYVKVLAPSTAEVGDHDETRQNIVALVRDSVYRDYVKEEDRDVITAHLLGDLWIIYAVDRPESTTILDGKKAAELGLDQSILLSVSKENLKHLLGDIHFTAYGECFSLGCEMICYASSALLFDYVWDQAAALVDGDVVVAVPARDTVIFTGSKNAKGLEALSEEARYVTLNGHHVVTDTLLRRVGGGWMVFA